jgi:DNA processing protein
MKGNVSPDEERRAWIFLNHVPYIGPVRFHKLVLAARSATAVLQMSALELTQADVGLELAEHWWRCLRDGNRLKAVENEETLENRGDFRILTELDGDYPDDLRNIPDRPPVVYVRGIWPPPPVKRIGIVGTRRASVYGLEVAESIARELALLKMATVSGLAAGIDTAVHESSLRHAGYTVAVLGHGLAHLFPRSNRTLFEVIGESGALLTEFPYAMAPQAAHFPRRNRIISGLSEAVIVVEAGEKSGALITARNAAEQGRDVFAVPGRLFQESSRGCHRLIKEGASIFTGLDDILGRTSALKAVQASEGRLDETTQDERELLDALTEDPMTIDDMIERRGGSVDQWLESLLSLELRKLIYRLPGQRYGRSR